MTDQTAIPLTFASELKELVIAVIHEPDMDHAQQAWETLRVLIDRNWMSAGTEEAQFQDRLILDQVVKVINKAKMVNIQTSAISWIDDKLSDIIKISSAEGAKDTKAYRLVADALDAEKLRASEQLEVIKKRDEPSTGYQQELAGWEDILDQVTNTQTRLWELASERLFQEQKALIEDEKDEDKRTVAIRMLATRNLMGSREALRVLVEQWVEWIKKGDKQRLVEIAAEAMRYNAYAVLPLIEHFGSDGYSVLDDHHNHNAGSQRTKNQDLPSGSEDNHADNAVPQATEHKSTQHQDLHNRLKVDRHIARQLADMSDTMYIDEADLGKAREYKYIKIELRKHAVPVMLRRLQDEKTGQHEEIENEIRQQIVRLLTYTGGREAVDTLASQLVAKEKMRKARQELLDEYYLKPALSRSEDAAGILNDTVASSKRTLRILQVMNIAVFLVGLTILTLGLFVSMNGKSDANRVIGALASLGGFVGMIALLIRDPLDRIQNAMADLVHVETAFTSFIWQLNLNGTFIQSLYVKNGKLEDEEIAGTAQRIEKAMQNSMRQVSVFTEQAAPRVAMRITAVKPAAGPFPAALTVRGQSLQGDSRQKMELSGIVAIDHQPAPVKIVSWEDHQVKFELPESLPAASAATAGNGDKKEVILISLFVDGMETNALPYHLMDSA